MIFLEEPSLILASASPRRQELLGQLGLEVAVVPSSFAEEGGLLKGEKSHQLAERFAQAKAEAVHQVHPDHFVLGADTIVVRGRQILGKTACREEAERNLTLLSGRRHRVYTSFCLCTPAQKRIIRTVLTTVTFKRLSREELKWYLNSGQWAGVAGSYAIQGKAAAFIKQINGSYTNVVGLPLYEVMQVLIGCGYFSPK